jgi:RHS repeat-associated protein
MTDGIRCVCCPSFRNFSVSLFFLFSTLIVVLAGWPVASHASVKTVMPDYYAEPGLNRFRDPLSVHAHEVIDPFTGGLQLRHLDFNAPGRGGFFLKIYRVYNSNNVYLTRDANMTAGGVPTILHPRSPTGLGWTIHFGRVIRSGADADPCDNSPGNTLDNPVLETPDGSQQILFNNSTSVNALFITRDQWVAHCQGGGLLVVSPDGHRYTMNYRVGGSYNNETTYAWYTTRIEDRNGNAVDITYRGAAGNGIDAILDSVTGAVSASFSYTGSGDSIRLTGISAGGLSRTYSFNSISNYAAPNYYHLVGVSNPAAGNMQYSYHSLAEGTAGNRLLATAKFMHGASTSYDYQFLCLNATEASGYVCDGAPTHYSTVVKTKKTAGTDITTGNWSYSYAQSTGEDRTTVTFPGGKTIYKHVGSRLQSTAGNLWKIGLLVEKATYNGTTLVEQENYAWDSGVISSEDYVRPPYDGSPGAPYYYDNNVRMPVLVQKTVKRDGTNYTTNYSNFTSDGSFRPQSTHESGQAQRTVNVNYPARNGLTNLLNIVGNETISTTQTGVVSTILRDHDGNGNLMRQVTNGVEERFTYHPGGDLYTRTNARGQVWTYTNYNRGIPQNELHPEGVHITRVVNNNGTIASETNGRGHTTSYTYDGLFRITSITPPAGSPIGVVWTTSIGSVGDTRTVTRGSYQQVTTFDGFGRPSYINTNGVTQDIKYNALGFKSFESYYSSTKGDTLTTDVLGRVLSITHPNTAITTTKRTYAYLANNQVKLTNERGKVITSTYRSFGDPNKKDLMQIAAPEGVTTVFTRDPLGHVLSVTQGGVTRSYDYDTHYFLTSESHPETGTTTYTRDAVGNMLSRQVGSSGLTRYTYDGLNRLVFTDYPGSTPDVTFQYDANYNLTLLDNGISRRVMTYDANNNLRTESLTVGSLTLNAAFGFNSLDQLTTITYPSLRQVSYAPDALGRPTQALPYLTSVAHHPNGVPKTLTFGNGHTTTNTLTNRQWLDTTITQKTGVGQVVNLNYDYDGLANVTKITNSLDTTDTKTLTYDGLDRLLTAGTASLTYDTAGNLRTYTTSAGTLTYGYTSQRLATVTGHTNRTYLYDPYGHTVSDGLRTLSWDDAGNLRTIGIYSHDYDGKNQRVRTKTPDGAETYTFTTQNGLTLGEYGPTGSYTREYAYLGTQLIALIDHDTYGSERTSYLHPNALGSPVAATDTQGNLLWKETYNPYGERKLKQPNSTTNNRWYTGHTEDPTGLVYAGARYYDPTIGRFLSTDPVAFTEKNPHSFNRYSYANNNPYKYVDPDGREPLSNFGDPQAEIDARIAGGGYFGADVLDYALSGMDFAVPGGAAAKVGGRMLERAAAKETPQVLRNKATGDAFRDEIGDLMKKEGREIQKEVVKDTPFGKRFVDIEVRKDGKPLGGIETKTGGSRHTPSQQSKDEWLRRNGYPVDLVRDR